MELNYRQKAILYLIAGLVALGLVVVAAHFALRPEPGPVATPMPAGWLPQIEEERPAPTPGGPQLSVASSWTRREVVKPVGGSKKPIHPGLWLFNGIHNTTVVDPSYGNYPDGDFWSDEDAIGYVLKVMWRNIQSSTSRYYNWTIIDDALAEVTAWNTAHPERLKYLIIRIDVFQENGCVGGSVGGYGIPSGFAAKTYLPANTNCNCYYQNGMLLPAYENAAMQSEYAYFMQQVAARYDSNAYVDSIQIGLGLYGERQPAKNEDVWCGAQNFLAGYVTDKNGSYITDKLTADEWIGWNSAAIIAAASAFTQTHLTVMTSPAYGVWSDGFIAPGASTTIKATDRYWTSILALAQNPPVGLQWNTWDEWSGLGMGYYFWKCGNIPNYNPTWWPAKGTYSCSSQWSPEYGEVTWITDATLEDYDHAVAPVTLYGTSWRDIPVGAERGKWAAQGIFAMGPNYAYDGYTPWWSYLQALSKHADYLFPNDSDGAVWTGSTWITYPAGMLCFECMNPTIPFSTSINWMNDFVNAYAGTFEDTTPGAWWAAFNSPDLGGYQYYDSQQHMDHEFFLHRMDVYTGYMTYKDKTKNQGDDLAQIADDDVVSEIQWWTCYNLNNTVKSCPAPSSSIPNPPPFYEGTYLKRTNQATSDNKAYFDIADGYRWRAPVAEGRWEVHFKMLDRGTDAVTFNYKDEAGASKVYTMTKTNTGYWLWWDFTLTDFFHANQISTGAGGADFYLDSLGDGLDEYYNMIILNHRWDQEPEPTSTATMVGTATPTSQTPSATPEAT